MPDRSSEGRNAALRFAVAATANCTLISPSSETKQRQTQSISPWLSSEYICANVRIRRWRNTFRDKHDTAPRQLTTISPGMEISPIEKG